MDAVEHVLKAHHLTIDKGDGIMNYIEALSQI